MFDLAVAPAYFFKAIPPLYSAALMRANRTHGENGVYSMETAEVIADEMARILEE